MCSIDYDRPEFYFENIRVARKEHTCCECDRIIKIKERYQSASGQWLGDFDVFKTCAHCMIGQIFLSKACNGWQFGGLWEDLKSHAEEYRHFGLYRMVIGMRRKWKKFKSDGLMPIPKELSV